MSQCKLSRCFSYMILLEYCITSFVILDDGSDPTDVIAKEQGHMKPSSSQDSNETSESKTPTSPLDTDTKDSKL